ncbi:hypothetical protein SHIRM173S_12072 [Streptomyces hirsutus]
MRQSLGQLLRPATVGVLALVAMWAPCGSPAAAPAAPPAPEASSLAFDQRYHALQHGGIVRAANSSATCRTAQASSCADVQAGAQAVNGDFDMFYVDVDRDPNTYNSSRSEVRLPPGSQVTYARLYWGGNLRVGEQKPAEDNGRVLIAEPGGDYKELLRGHRRGTRRGGRRGRLPGLGGRDRASAGQRAGSVHRGAGQRGRRPVGGRRVGRLDPGGGVREPGGAAAAPLASGTASHH